MRRPEAVYNNLNVELAVEADSIDSDRNERKLIYALSISFIVFWLPFFTIRGLYELGHDSSRSIEGILIQLFAYIFGYFKSAVTPIIILIFYPESRTLLRKLREIDCVKLWRKKSDAV